MGIKRSQDEIDEVRNWAMEGMDSGTKFPGMSYEDGVEDALAWVVGDKDDRPDTE